MGSVTGLRGADAPSLDASRAGETAEPNAALTLTARPGLVARWSNLRWLIALRSFALFLLLWYGLSVWNANPIQLPSPLRANLVFGVPGGIDATPDALEAMLRPLPPDTHWSITAVGRHQRRMLGIAILRGAGGIRVGFEDSVYLRRGVLAASNAELVADACELVRTLGRRPATIDEARELLACPGR